MFEGYKQVNKNDARIIEYRTCLETILRDNRQNTNVEITNFWIEETENETKRKVSLNITNETSIERNLRIIAYGEEAGFDKVIIDDIY